MFSKMKIGDFGALNSISVQTLRYYEKIGLIKPVAIDAETNYRYYHLNQSATVDIIQFLKRFEFSLEEIKDLLEEADDLNHLSALLKLKHASLVAEQAALEERISSLATFQEAMVDYAENQQKNVMEIKAFPKRYLLSYPIAQNIYQMSELEYEAYLREFKQFLVQRGSETADFNRVGSLMSRERFEGNAFVSQELFIFVSKKRGLLPATKELPAGTYAVYYCQSFQEELANLPAFKALIAAQGLTIMGDYICEVIYEIPKLHQNQRKMFIRMQVPVA